MAHPRRWKPATAKLKSYTRKAKRPRPMEGRDESGATWRFLIGECLTEKSDSRHANCLSCIGIHRLHILCKSVTQSTPYMSREVVRHLRRGWSVDAFHFLPGTHRTQRRGRGLLQERCPRDVAVVVRKDLLQSSWANARAVEPWLPFELTVGELLDLTRRTDRLS